MQEAVALPEVVEEALEELAALVFKYPRDNLDAVAQPGVLEDVVG